MQALFQKIYYNKEKIGIDLIMNIVEKPATQEQEKLIQSEFNTNVAFYVHLKAFDNKVRKRVRKRLQEVFFSQEELIGNLIVLE